MVFKIEKNGYFIVDSKSLRRFLRQLSGCFIFCVVVPEKKDIWKKKRSGTLLSALICTEILSLVWASL